MCGIGMCGLGLGLRVGVSGGYLGSGVNCRVSTVGCQLVGSWQVQVLMLVLVTGYMVADVFHLCYQLLTGSWQVATGTITRPRRQQGQVRGLV